MPKRIHDGLKKRCNHARKTWHDCACPWWFGFHHGGREYRYSLTKVADARRVDRPKSKDDAIIWRDRLRAEIRSGTFVDPDAPVPAVQSDVRLTFGDVCDEYVKHHVRTPTRRAGGRKMMELLVAVIRRAEIPAAFASRLLESSADLHDVQMFLGHADITTTSRYLQSTPTRLARALKRMEGGSDVDENSPGAPGVFETSQGAKSNAVPN